MNVGIVTDSVADIPKELAEKLGIVVVPLYVEFGQQKSYRDNVDISCQEFYRRLIEGPIHPTTSAASPGDFVQIFRELAQKTKAIVAILLLKKLSATYNNACQAKEMVEKETGCQITVIDSTFGALAEGLLVIAAAKLAREGKNQEEIVSAVHQTIPKIRFLAIVDTLKYLEKGGRVKKEILKGFVGFTKVKPLFTFSGGEVRNYMPPAILGNMKKKMIFRFIKKYPNVQEIGLEYSPDTDGKTEKIIEEFKQEIQREYPDVVVHTSIFTPVMGTHSGPGVLAVSLRTE